MDACVSNVSSSGGLVVFLIVLGIDSTLYIQFRLLKRVT